MIIILVCIVVVALWTYWTDEDWLFSILSGVTVGLFIGVMLAVVVGTFVYDGTHREQTRPIPLQSLVDGSDIRGSFFLGSGIIDNVSVFTWYEQTSGNAYVQRKADANISTVHFLPADSKTKPYYVRTDKVYDATGSWLKPWGFALDTGVDYSSGYDFYVPRGTIKHNYNLDAQ